MESKQWFPVGCTGPSAGWCHNCGDCTCDYESEEYEKLSKSCPLHGPNSQHWELDNELWKIFMLCGGREDLPF